MASLKQTFRLWWQPPRKTIEREEERKVTFLELFYDLVYVVLIAELAHAFSTHVNWEGLVSFVGLFILVWVAWLNGASYHDLHGNNDVRTRIFTFLQMFTVAAMAVFAHNASGEGSVGFALSFASYQLIVTYLWWRTGVHDPNHRPLSNPYSLAFLVSTFLFGSSVFVPIPWRFYMWIIGLFISVVLPMFTLLISQTIFGKRSNNAQIQAEIDRSYTLSPSAIERFGLFTIIVLGEVIVGVVSGVAEHHHLTWTVGITAALGMLIAIGLWWIYFDFVSQHPPKFTRNTVASWIYLHLFITMGIVATGAATLNVVEHAGEHLPTEVRWLLVGSIGLVLICIAVLMRIIQIPDELYQAYRTGGIVTFICGLLVLLLGFLGLETIPLLVILIFLMLAPVFYGIKVWIKMLVERENIS